MSGMINWLMDNLGAPQQIKPISFVAEYLLKGGQYTGTKMVAVNLSRAIENIINQEGRKVVGRIVLTPIVLKEEQKFQLINSHRIY